MTKKRAKKVAAGSDGAALLEDLRQPEDDFPGCTLKFLPEEDRYSAAEVAWEEAPTNEPTTPHSDTLGRQELALLTTKWWGAKGVDLGVYFDTSSQALKSKLLQFFNMWQGSGRANIRAREASVGMAQVRVSFAPRDGYWSYLGTDILHIRNGPTMNLAGFTASTPDATFHRVACHEFGHTLGCPHEHLRKKFVDNIDVQAAIDYFRRTQGWDEGMIRSNVLTPLEERSLYGVPPLEETSIMAYQLPAEIMKDRRPFRGGDRITETDLDYIATCYPGQVAPPPPPSPPPVNPPTDRRKLLVELLEELLKLIRS